jgi:radical SAM protein with 4Fe4S-binding SPASM domain
MWGGNRPLLTHLDVELTERCNNSCIHCCINLPEYHPYATRELSTGQWERILTEAADLGALSVRFTGGEPLLRNDFADLYLFARKIGLKVMIYTNARLITPAIADLLARVPPREKVEVTAYGMTPGSYEKISLVKGSYDQFRRGLDLLTERKVPFIVKGVVLPQNRNEVSQFVAWAASIPGMRRPPKLTVSLELRSRRDLSGKNRVIRQNRLPPDDVVSASYIGREQYLDEMKQFFSKFPSFSGDSLFSCGAGSRPCVDAYGQLQPCLMMRYPDTAYDLTSGSLKEALTVFFPKLQEMKAVNPEYLRRCARCFIRGLCGQCPARSWMEHGTLDTPVEYFCRIAHSRAQDLGLLFEGESAFEIDNWYERVRQFLQNSKI